MITHTCIPKVNVSNEKRKKVMKTFLYRLDFNIYEFRLFLTKIDEKLVDKYSIKLTINVIEKKNVK